MTMLDRMRRHKNWLKWSLILVCLAFVVFYIPDFLRDQTTDLAATDTVATVEGSEISGSEFLRSYQAQVQAYRTAYGGNMSDQLLRQLGVDQQILQQMVDERAALAEATRLGIRVSDEEVRQRILTLPAFQQDGVFIGEQRYVELLAVQRPPMTPQEFEEGIRRALAVDKLRTTLTAWLAIPDRDLEQEYRRRNEKVKLAVVSLPIDHFRSDVTATDAEVATYFGSHGDEFRVPEKRKIRFILADVEAIRSKIVVPAADIERSYNDNFEQYSTPEELRASHILLRTEGKDEAAVRARAEELLKQVRAGADFAQLAMKESEDEATASKGGDLDFFGRGRMVPEFDEAAFALEPGQVSELVKTPYGFHIIKVTEKKPGTTRSLDEVRPQITQQLSAERAEAQAADVIERVAAQVKRPADLATAAAANDLTVQESDLFAAADPILGLGPAPEVTARVFAMKDDEVSGILTTGRGFVIAAISERQDARPSQLEEVRERVRDAVIRQKAAELSRKKAADLSATLKTAGNFDAAGKAAGFPAQTTELLTRDSPIPQLGVVPAVTDAAFKLPTGGVTDPIPTDTGTAIVKVLEKDDVTPEELAADKDRFREELLADRGNRFFSAYMANAKRNMKIAVSREVLQRLVGQP